MVELEEVIELLLYPDNLVKALVGEGTRQVAAHDAASVADDVIEGIEEQVRQGIEHAEGQKRQQSDEEANNVIIQGIERPKRHLPVLAFGCFIIVYAH